MTNNTEPLYTANDLKDIFHCGINRAYEILAQSDLPVTRVGGVLAVRDGQLRKWLQTKIGTRLQLKA